MGEVINLRGARKARARTAAQTEAATNRPRFGRTKAEKRRDEQDAERLARALDGAERSVRRPIVDDEA